MSENTSVEDDAFLEDPYPEGQQDEALPTDADVLWCWKAKDEAEALLVRRGDGVQLFWRDENGHTTPSYLLHDWEVELLRQVLAGGRPPEPAGNEDPAPAAQQLLFS